MKTKLQREHTEMVNSLKKDGKLIKKELTPARADLWHAATGIASEAGEILDAIKKVCVYDQVVDRENIIEELGDLEFYMEQLRQNLHIGRDTTLQYNMDKLAIRYKNYKYSNEQAKLRNDKKNK